MQNTEEYVLPEECLLMKFIVKLIEFQKNN